MDIYDPVTNAVRSTGTEKELLSEKGEERDERD